MVNPTLTVEVTSRSTEDSDRGDKLSHFKQLESLQAVVFVSHRSQRVTVIAREGATWKERDYRAGESLTLATPALTLAVNDVYAGVTLEQS